MSKVVWDIEQDTKRFPGCSDEVAQIERDVGATCLKDKDGRIFLFDELPIWRGDPVEERLYRIVLYLPN